MEITLDPLKILLLLGAAHAVLLALALLTIQRGNRAANRIFALLLLVFAVTMVFHIVGSTQFLLRYPHFSKIEPVFVFLLAPLFYFYVAAMTTPSYRFDKAHVLHFLPALICAGFLTPYYLQSADHKIEHILADLEGFCIHCFLIHWFVTLQIFIYLVVIARMLMKYKRKIKASFSSLEKINLDWLRNLLVAVFIAWMASVVLRPFSPSGQADTISWLFVSVSIFLIGYIGLKQPEIFTGDANDLLKEGKGSQRKYERSTLTPEKAEAHLEKLQRLIATEKPFLESDLTLPALAKRLSISTHHLSQIINEKLQQNFFEFINSHRVEEAKSRIADPANRNLNLAEIGFDVGFNSLSSFHAAFKKHTGTTPSQFKTETVE